MASILRGKKKIISLLSSSAGGRGAMMKLIGSDGEACMNAISAATTVTSGAKAAAEQSKLVFKVASKAALMIKENLITPAQLSETLQICAVLVNDVVEISSTRLDFLDVEIATSTVLRHLAKVEAALTKVISPHTSDRTTAKLTALFAQFRERSYIVQFISDPALADTRRALRNALQALIPQARITGTPRFNKRDNETMKDMIACPRLDQFVTDAKRMTYFRAFLEENGVSPSPLMFCSAVGAFKQIRNKSVMTSRAEIICDKFMTASSAECIPSLDPALVAKVCFYLPLHFKRVLLTILTCPPHILTFKNPGQGTGGSGIEEARYFSNCRGGGFVVVEMDGR